MPDAESDGSVLSRAMVSRDIWEFVSKEDPQPHFIPRNGVHTIEYKYALTSLTCERLSNLERGSAAVSHDKVYLST